MMLEEGEEEDGVEEIGVPATEPNKMTSPGRDSGSSHGTLSASSPPDCGPA